MAKIILEGPQPFDLVAPQQPTSSAELGIVAMTLPVYAPDSPSNVVQIRLLMTPEQDRLTFRTSPALDGRQ